MPVSPQISTMKYKSRNLDFGRDVINSGVKIYGNDYPNGTKPWVATGFQDTWSEGHPFHLLGKGVNGNNIGGAFRTEKRFVTDHLGGQEIDVSKLPRFKGLSQPSGNIVYYGEAAALPTSLPSTRAHYPPNLDSSEEELFAKGGTAIARCKPTNSIANLAQALIELKRDGMPALTGANLKNVTFNKKLPARKRLEGAASEYLNSVFGWTPMGSDIDSFAYAAEHSGELWRQYQKDAGKWVRRSYKFPLERTTDTLQVVPNTVDPYGFASPVYRQSQGTYTLTRHVQRRTWFSGAFTYHLPERTGYAALDKVLSLASQARYLYGLSIDPATAYAVAPWSWLIDWFVNLGDVISNLTSLSYDGLAMPYGYIMEHVTVTDVHQLTGIEYAYGTQGPQPRVICYVTETKQRLAASPYGFGVTWDSFSPSQLAILAALGISRGGSAVPHVR